MTVPYDYAYARRNISNIPAPTTRKGILRLRLIRRYPKFWATMKTAALLILFQWVVACLGWVATSNSPTVSTAANLADFLDWQVAITLALFISGFILGSLRQRAARDRL